MTVPVILALLRKSEHLALTKSTSQVSNAVEAYAVFRSYMVLARYDEGMEVAKQFESWFAGDVFLQTLVDTQRLIYVTREWNQAKDLLYSLKDNLPEQTENSSYAQYLRGEFYFLLGYTYNLSEKFRSGIAFHELAENYFRLVGFEGHRAQALNNLCACYNHLNEESLFASTFAKLRGLNKVEGVKGVQIPYHRVNAAVFLDREEYQEALSEFIQCLNHAEEEGRFRDVGSALCMAAYLCLKVGNYSSFETIKIAYNKNKGRLQSDHDTVIRYYLEFSTTEYFDGLTADSFLAKWAADQINSIHHLYLVDILCDRLAKARDYERLLEVASAGTDTALKAGQGINLVDFRFYEAKARMRLGELDRAQRLLMIFEQDAIADDSKNRIEKAKHLKEELLLCRQSQNGNVLTPNFGGGTHDKKVLRLNPTLHQFSYDGLVVDLSPKPVLERCLVILSQQTEMIALSDFFTLIYEIDFNPTLHERRLHSLIDRVRKLFSDSDVLLRREGKLGWNPRIRVEVVEEPAVQDEVNDRKTKLLSVIRQAGQPLALREIEKRFPCSRRTLQFDLHELLSNQLISVAGNSRNRKYFSQ